AASRLFILTVELLESRWDWDRRGLWGLAAATGSGASWDVRNRLPRQERSRDGDGCGKELGALPEGVGTRIVIRITANVNRSSPASDAPEGPRGFGWPESRRSRPGWRGRGGGKINQTGSAAGWAPWGPRVAT